jgi:hypothetical protein
MKTRTWRRTDTATGTATRRVVLAGIALAAGLVSLQLAVPPTAAAACSIHVPDCGPPGPADPSPHQVVSGPFANWARLPGVKLVHGDFAGDGRDDLALAGGAEWTTVPVAFSQGDGRFTVTNRAVVNVPGWASQSGVKLVSGDFNGDGRDDLALACGAEWTTVPVAFSLGDGRFTVTNHEA